METLDFKPEPNQKWVIHVSRSKFIIISVLVVIAALLWFTMISGPRSSVNLAGFSAPSGSQSGGMMSISSQSASYYPNDNYGQPAVTDTREFLKTSYSADIRTRDVAGVITDVKNSVKGADGRIDSSYSSEKSGRITFVVAKSKFDAFRDEIAAIANAKLYSETISSQNLLSQKQSIEQSSASITSTLDGLKKQKDALLARHNQEIGLVNGELTRIATSLVTTRASIGDNTDTQILASLRAQETSLVDQDATQRQKLATENSDYSAQKSALDSRIAATNASLTNVATQDSNFTDNIETVSGNVSVQWISYWQLAKIFSPVSPSIIMLVLAIIAWVYLKRKGYVPGIEWK